MKYFFWTCAVAILSFGIMIYQIRTDLQKNAISRINYALKNAVHDGAMMINKSRFADGFIYFDDDKVDEVVLQSLRINLSLDENLAPKNTMLIRKPLRIISKVMIDDRKLVPSCTSFPCIYEYKDATKNIDFEKPIFGPSVVYVIEAEVFGANKPLTFITIQEYKN